MPRGRRPRHDRGAVRFEVFHIGNRAAISAEFPPGGGRLNIVYFREDLTPSERERAANWLSAVAGDLSHDQAYAKLWGAG